MVCVCGGGGGVTNIILNSLIIQPSCLQQFPNIFTTAFRKEKRHSFQLLKQYIMHIKTNYVSNVGHPHLFLCFSSIWFAKVGSVGQQKKVGQNI